MQSPVTRDPELGAPPVSPYRLEVSFSPIHSMTAVRTRDRQSTAFFRYCKRVPLMCIRASYPPDADVRLVRLSLAAGGVRSFHPTRGDIVGTRIVRFPRMGIVGAHEPVAVRVDTGRKIKTISMDTVDYEYAKFDHEYVQMRATGAGDYVVAVMLTLLVGPGKHPVVLGPVVFTTQIANASVGRAYVPAGQRVTCTTVTMRRTLRQYLENTVVAEKGVPGLAPVMPQEATTSCKRRLEDGDGDFGAARVLAALSQAGSP